MTPMQQILLGVGAKKKTYMDDVFSTYLFAGNAGTQAINNGIDLAGEGGLVWTKNRASAFNHFLYDTESGVQKYLQSDGSAAQASGTTLANTSLTAFNSNGFTLGAGDYGNINSGVKASSWTFRKAPGFFDIVTWTGNGSGPRSISHSLGSVPGLIMVKCTSNASTDWMVWHRDFGPKDYLVLNGTAAKATNEAKFGGQLSGSAAPTSTTFAVGTSSDVNGSGKTYVAYLFAGGESTAAGANCIGFDSQNDRITCGSASSTTADFNFGTGALTLECWIKCASTQCHYPRIISFGPFWGANQAFLSWDNDYQANKVTFRSYNYSGSAANALLESSTKGFAGDGQWHHIAVSRSGDTWRLFVDGILEDTETWTGSLTNANMYGSVGNVVESNSSAYFNGEISNVRVVKGTAVYTSSFRPPTEPLTNITNTKLLCCNAASATSATVTPITLTESSVGENNTDSPFDDPAAHVFGESGSESVIKCGSYVGNGSATGPEINLGFEPQWIMWKNADESQNWVMVDALRGVVSGGADARLSPNTSVAENTGMDVIEVTSSGFKVTSSDTIVNGSNDNFVYMAIRRPDGYVGKPPSLGTDVFSLDVADGSTNPSFISNFPVDFSFYKQPASADSWYTSARLIGTKYLKTDSNAAEATSANFTWDYNDGWRTTGLSSSWQAWSWKRHAGFDCITYTGNNVNGRHLRHNLSKPPEMVWFKVITNGSGVNWMAGHKGLNGGVNPWEYYIEPNTDSDQTDYPAWMDTAPTSTHIAVSNVNQTNNTNNKRYVAMLFASVDGISKCGYYDGSNSDQTITLGFQPRFVIVKSSSHNFGWLQLDSTKGWATSSGNNSNALFLNSTNAQVSVNAGYTTSTGFVAKGQYDNISGDGVKYIYYAHA